MLAYCDDTRESLAGMLRRGSAGSNTVADHLTVLDAAITAARPGRWGNSRLAETVRETLLPGPNINLAAPQEASNYQGEAS